MKQSLDVIHKHAQDWKLNTKKSNIIIFSGNGQNKNNVNFKYENETLQIVEKQTSLGIEMTSSGRYTNVRDILSKEAMKVLSIINGSFANTHTATVVIKNKLFNALVKPVSLHACEIWGKELLSYKTLFDKSTIEQTAIKRSMVGRYPLSIDIKASIFSYWQRLKHSTNNAFFFLSEAFQYVTKYTPFFDIQKNIKKSMKSVQ